MNRFLWRYIVVGLIGTVAHITTLYCLVEFLNLPPVLASVCGFLVALLSSYALNSLWTFGAVKQKHQRAFIRYTLVSITGLVLNTLIMFTLINVVGLWYMLSQGIAAVAVPLHNFLINFYWTFDREEQKSKRRDSLWQYSPFRRPRFTG